MEYNRDDPVEASILVNTDWLFCSILLIKEASDGIKFIVIDINNKCKPNNIEEIGNLVGKNQERQGNPLVYCNSFNNLFYRKTAQYK